MSHTPGPWKIDTESETSCCKRYIQSSAGEYIGEISSDSGETETVANARLIAAAPKLLEALKAAESYIETPDDLTPQDKTYLQDDIQIAITAAIGDER